MINVGVVGYSSKGFDRTKAIELIKEAFDLILDLGHKDISIVSGLTAIGIPKLAYEEADRRGWKTIGVACKKAYEFPLHDCDIVRIVGDNWGDESEEFLSLLSILIRVGGGPQSLQECNRAKLLGVTVVEFELERTD